MNSDLLVHSLIIVGISIFLSIMLLTFYRKTEYLKIFCEAYACYVSSHLLLHFQSHNNLFFSSVISHIFLVAGYTLLSSSILSFFSGRLEWPKRFWGYIALAGIFSYATAILSYNVISRNILVGTLTVVIFIDLGFNIFGKLNRVSPVVRSAILISSLVSIITNAIRPMIVLTTLTSQDLLVDNDTLNIIVFTSFVVTSIFWLATLILLDGSRMLDETKNIEERYRTLMDSTDAGVVMINRQGQFLLVNPVAASMLEKTQEELLGKDVRDLFPLYQQEILLADIEQVIVSNQGLTKETVTTIDRNTRYFMTSMQPIQNEFGTPYAVMFLITDISDIRIAQDQIKISENNYRTLFFESPSAKLVYQDNRIIDCNNAAEKLLEGERSQILGLTVGDISPEYQPNGKKSGEFAVEVLQDELQTKPDSFEWVLKKFDGTEFIVYVQVNAIIYDGKQVVLATWVDVTEQRKAEEGLRKLSRAVEQSPVSIVITNKDGEIEYANPKASETTGYTVEELYRENPRILQSGDTSKKEYEELWSKIQYGNEWRGIFHNKRKNGELYWESAIISPVIDTSGNITHYIGIKEDITERKYIEEALKTNENRLAQVTEHSRTVIWELDVEGRYTYINDVCEVVYGFSAEDLVGRYNYEIIPSDVRQAYKDSFDKTGFQILENGKEILNFERKIQKKDGTVIWVSTNATPIHDKDNNITGFMGSDNDITARKVAEAETRKFKTIADQADYGNIIASMDGTLIYVNEAFSKMHGWNMDELVGQNLLSLHGPEHLGRFNSLLENIKSQGGFAAEEVGRVKRDGSRFSSLMSAKIIRDSNNSSQFISATVIDISEMKKKDKEIKKLSLAIEQSPVAVVITDLEGFIQYVSPAFEAITGYHSTEIIGKHTRILKSGKTKPEVYQDLWNNILAGKSWKGEWSNKKKDGELYFESVSITPFNDEEGNMAYYLAVKEDITQRKNSEMALIKSEEQFRLLFTESPVSMIIHDRESGEIIDSNPETSRIFGLSSLSDIENYKGWSDSPYTRDEYISLVKSVAQSGPQQVEWQFKRPNGEMIWLNLNLTSIEMGGVLRVITTATDTTKLKQAEQDKVALQVAEEANRTKSIFLSNVSHEIRTPLNAIIGFAQILHRDKTLSPKQSEYVNTILHSGEHLIGLINDILDLSKIEAGRLTLKEKEFNLEDLLADIRNMFSLRAKEKNLYFEFEIDENVPKFMNSDEAKLRQVFINLLGNAFKFTTTGGITLRVRVEQADQNTQESISLSVEVIDTGQGISDEDKELIFKPFLQAEAGQAEGGTGLGLAICRDIIGMMGGELTVESKIGQGSTFRFNIMVKASENADNKKIHIQDNVIGLAPSTGPFRVLIVDDRQDNRVVLRNLLEPVGFEVKEAENGQEAVGAFTEWKPHAILMDIRMPVMDGYEAIKRIRATEQGKSVLVIGITASIFVEDMIKVKEARADDVLNKPFKVEALFSLLSHIPGLTFIYEEVKEEITRGGDMEMEDCRQAIAGLPIELVEAMGFAVEKGNMVQLRKLADQVEKLNPRVAKELFALSRKYDYEKLRKLLKTKEEETNV